MSTDMFDLAEIGERLRTQDNRITAEPMFLVQERTRTYGIDLEWDPPVAWLYEDESAEVAPEEAERLEAAYLETDDEPEGFRRVGYHEQWTFVTACFTEAAADLYIAQMKHRHTGPLRTFVGCAYRNHEWNAVREFLKSLPPVARTEPAAPADSVERSAEQ